MKTSNRVRLTRRVVDARIASHNAGQRQRVWDTEVTDLFLQITPKGSAGYYIRYRRADGTTTDFALASADLVSPDQAREAAGRHLATLKLEGVEPVKAKRAAVEEAKAARLQTFAALVQRYDEMHPDYSDSDKETRRYYMGRYILPRLGKRNFKDIKVEDVRALVREVQQVIAKSPIAIARGGKGHDGANLCQFLIRLFFTSVSLMKRTLTQIEGSGRGHVTYVQQRGPHVPGRTVHRYGGDRLDLPAARLVQARRHRLPPHPHRERPEGRDEDARRGR